MINRPLFSNHNNNYNISLVDSLSSKKGGSLSFSQSPRQRELKANLRGIPALHRGRFAAPCRNAKRGAGALAHAPLWAKSSLGSLLTYSVSIVLLVSVKSPSAKAASLYIFFLTGRRPTIGLSLRLFRIGLGRERSSAKNVSKTSRDDRESPNACLLMPDSTPSYSNLNQKREVLSLVRSAPHVLTTFRPAS